MRLSHHRNPWDTKNDQVRTTLYIDVMNVLFEYVQFMNSSLFFLAGQLKLPILCLWFRVSRNDLGLPEVFIRDSMCCMVEYGIVSCFGKAMLLFGHLWWWIWLVVELHSTTVAAKIKEILSLGVNWIINNSEPRQASIPHSWCFIFNPSLIETVTNTTTFILPFPSLYYVYREKSKTDGMGHQNYQQIYWGYFWRGSGGEGITYEPRNTRLGMSCIFFSYLSMNSELLFSQWLHPLTSVCKEDTC